MKIVLISGNIYPHISARAFRATELACGLAKLGHQVTLYGLLGNYDYSDFKKEHPNLTVKNFGKSYMGIEDSDGKLPKFFNNKVSIFFLKVLYKLMNSWIDYPRCEFFFMTKNALKKEDNFDYLITIAHPYGCHWGAAYYKKYIDNKKFKYWTADCGDPFMGDKYFNRHELFLKPLEKFWCRMVDNITIPVAKGITGYYPEFRHKISIIPQSIDFDSIQIENYKSNDVPTFLYSGAVYPGMRDPSNFLNYLSTLKSDFKFITCTKSKFYDKFKEKLGKKLEIRDFIPRIELIRLMSTMDFLINIENESANQTPSKLIDYALAKRPILDVSTAFSTKEKENFDNFLLGNYSNAHVVKNIERYDSKNVSKAFLDLVN